LQHNELRVYKRENEIIIKVWDLYSSSAYSAIENDDDEKWIASICPIETIPALCSEFLLIRRSSFSNPLSLSLALSLSLSFSLLLSLQYVSPTYGLPPHVYPTSSPTGNQFEQVQYNDISFGTRRREKRRASFFPTFLRTAASHAVSTRVNFNSLSNDPQGSDLTDTRRPLVRQYKPAIRISSIICIHRNKNNGKVIRGMSYLMTLMT